ncbi:hypothetical protein WJX73_000421 [Symbiochloris irregularis]|uniref:Uncharacterized protein n=1 Tax=Symbiochloris irregularis TaxID=706552 RepID=A0AAW1NZX5_9CHLO
MASSLRVCTALLAASLLLVNVAGQGSNYCTTLTPAAGSPGPYGIWNTTDAWKQNPTYQIVCPLGVVGYEIDTSTAPNVYYTNPANLGQSQINIPATIRLYCGDGSVQSTITGEGYGDYDPFYVSVTPASTLMPPLVIPNTTQIPASAGLTISTNSTPWLQLPWTGGVASSNLVTLQCPSGTEWVGINFAWFWGGIDYFQMLCAPSCWNGVPSSQLPAVDGGASTPQLDYSQLGLTPSPTTCNSQQYANAIYSIGPGPSALYGTSNPTLIGSATPENLTYTVCPNGGYITQWDLRGYTSEVGLASLGARCSDGTLLAPVPSLADSAASPNFGFDVYQIQNNTHGWSTFDALAFDGTDQTPLLDFLGVGGGAGATLQCPQWGDFPCDECIHEAPGPPARAIGYQASALSTGGVTLLNVLCAFACQSDMPPYPNSWLAGEPQPNYPPNAPPRPPSPPPPPPMGPWKPQRSPASPQGSGAATTPTSGPSSSLMPFLPNMIAPATTPTPSRPPPTTINSCNNGIQAHIGPGAYGAYADAVAQNGVYLLVEICPENTFITSWSFRNDQYTTASSNGSVTTLIGSLSATCSDGSTLSAATRQSETGGPGSWANGSTQTDATESTLGYSSFELTPLTQQALTEFIGYDNNIVQNETLACPSGYNAIGYSALSSFFGIPYLDIICGPIVPNTCQAGAPGTGTVSTQGNNGNPFLYTSSSGGPSWTNYGPGAPTTTTGYVAPPPPNAPGDSINGAALSPSQTVLEVVIALTGPNLWPFTLQMQNNFVASIAAALNINVGIIHFIKSTLTNPVTTVATTGRRLQELQAPSRQLLQASTNKILAAHNLTATAKLESTKAQTTLSAADTTPSSGSSGLSGGAIAGIVIGSIVGAILLATAAYFAVRYYRRRQAGRAGMNGGASAMPTAAQSYAPSGVATPARGNKTPGGQTNIAAAAY